MLYAVYSMHGPYGRRASAIGRVILSVVLVVTTVWLGDVLVAFMLYVVGLTKGIRVCWRWWCWFEIADLSLFILSLVLAHFSALWTPAPLIRCCAATGMHEPTTIGGAGRTLL